MDEPQMPTSKHEVLALTADIAASFVSGNKISTEDLPALVRQIHATLSSLGPNGNPAPHAQEPAVPIKNSVKPDYIICLEDGKKFKSLKRHLRSFDLTPDQYRVKWGLAYDYPMVAPAYAAQRSELARKIGLGGMRSKAKAAKANTGSAARSSGRRKAKAAKAVKA